MANFVKFDRKQNKAFATGSSKDADTIYFTTDTRQIVLGGKVYGDGVNHHKVATKTEVVRAKGKLGSLFLQGIKCDNLGGLLYVANLNDISDVTANPSEKAPDNANTATYIKSVVDDDHWIGLFTVDSTAGRYAFNMTVSHASGYEEHYKFLVIEDTPPTGTFSFVTDCPWIMTGRYTTNKLACFAKLPEDFIGSVKVQLNRAHVTSGGNVGSFGSWDKTPTDFMPYIARTISTGGDKTYTTKFTTEEVNSKWLALSRGSFPEKPGGDGPANPLGKYTDSVNMVVDLGPVSVGDFVADFEINDILLHSLESAVGNHEVRISTLESGTANYYHVPLYSDEGLPIGAGIGINDMYVPKAGADQLGVIQLGYTTNGKNYAVVVDDNDRAYVTVPWTDTNTNYYHTPAHTSGDLKIGTGTGINDMYVPNATSDQLGVVKLFDNIRQSVAANKVSTTVGRTYGVQLNSSGQMVVNVPWTTKTLVDLVGSKAIGTATRPVYWNGSNFVQANSYPTVPQATASQLGGIKLGYASSGKNYAVEVDTNGKAYVTVPWTDTNTNSYHTPYYTSGLKIASGANIDNMYVPKAGYNQLGVIKLGYDSSGDNHAVEVDANGNAYVEVPRVFSETWTAYTGGTGGAARLSAINIGCNVLRAVQYTSTTYDTVNVYIENGHAGNNIEFDNTGAIYYSTSNNNGSYLEHIFNSDISISISSNNDRAGKVSAPGGFFQTSDIRKKNVLGELDLNKAYDLIDKCQTIIYSLKNNPNKEQIGLIAQEVQQFFPEIISEDEEGMLSLDYAKLTVVILRVLKDLIARVSKLESK